MKIPSTIELKKALHLPHIHVSCTSFTLMKTFAFFIRFIYEMTAHVATRCLLGEDKSLQLCTQNDQNRMYMCRIQGKHIFIRIHLLNKQSQRTGNIKLRFILTSPASLT